VVHLPVPHTRAHSQALDKSQRVYREQHEYTEVCQERQKELDVIQANIRAIKEKHARVHSVHEVEARCLAAVKVCVCVGGGVGAHSLEPPASLVVVCGSVAVWYVVVVCGSVAVWYVAVACCCGMVLKHCVEACAVLRYCVAVLCCGIVLKHCVAVLC
jgi:hypothetical protein